MTNWYSDDEWVDRPIEEARNAADQGHTLVFQFWAMVSIVRVLMKIAWAIKDRKND